MGGIGKTTIARALVTRIASKFAGSSFVSDVRENSSSKKDICALQEKILKDILVAERGFGIQDPENGAEMIQERLCKKKVLLVLDDVDDVKQLDFLAETHEWFGPGSRIIITTRDEHLLSNANAKYKPPFLNEDQAIELFSKHAFRKNTPPKEYKELSNRAIRYTGRLPLALKVLGSFFRGKEKPSVWKSALDRLAETPNKEIFDTLKLSYDGLEDSEKKIFLDIACFFKGEDIDRVTRVLDSSGFYAGIGITSLVEKSLITVSEGCIGMHDRIQEMGWQIVRESAPNSRIWKLEQFHVFTKKNRELESVEAIVFPWEDRIGGFSADVFESTKNLRLLDVHGGFTCSEPTFLPDKLRWLSWDGYPFSSLRLGDMHQLVGLKIYSRYRKCSQIEHLWKGEKIMPNLKFIHLKELECLKRFPDVSGAPNIERLILSNCKNLVEVDESLGFLKRLVYLDMNGCYNLKRLPSRFEMESLEALNLSNCDSLKRLPKFSGARNIERLDLSFCWNLEEVDESLGFLKRLVYLDMNYCKNLKRLPSRFEMDSLETLILSFCCSLKRLPEFSGAPNIERLILSRCENLVEVDESLGFLKRLIYLNMKYCENLKRLPSRFEMESLEKLILSHCKSLKRLPEFSPCMLKLSHISLDWCRSLQNISSICHLSSLKRLDLNNCYQVQNLHGLPSRIQVLEANGCKSLEKIEDLLKKYECLYMINLFGCKKLLLVEENTKYLESMLRQSFLKKWAAMDGCLSVFIPGSKIPCWFEEPQHGGRIALKLPPIWKTQIMGFAICGVFRGLNPFSLPNIKLRFENDEMFVPKTEVDCINASAAEVEEEEWAVCMDYVPFSLFQGKARHIIQGNLVVGVSSWDEEAIRCGVHVVYKEDVESTQQIKPPPISSCYWKRNLYQSSKNSVTFMMRDPFETYG